MLSRQSREPLPHHMTSRRLQLCLFPPLASPSSSPSSLSWESLGRRIPLYRMQSCIPLSTAEVEARRDGERRSEEFLLFHLLHFVSTALSLSLLSACLSLSRFDWYAEPGLLCSAVWVCERCCMSGREGNRTAVAGGVNTHVHGHTHALKTPPVLHQETLFLN